MQGVRNPSPWQRGASGSRLFARAARLLRRIRAHLAALASLALPGEEPRPLGVQPLPRLPGCPAAATVAYPTAPQATRHAA